MLYHNFFQNFNLQKSFIELKNANQGLNMTENFKKVSVLYYTLIHPFYDFFVKIF